LDTEPPIVLTKINVDYSVHQRVKGAFVLICLKKPDSFSLGADHGISLLSLSWTGQTRILLSSQWVENPAFRGNGRAGVDTHH
jgi:hypothetical protein